MKYYSDIIMIHNPSIQFGNKTQMSPALYYLLRLKLITGLDIINPKPAFHQIIECD
jgi:hypothetical protein